MQKNLLTQLCAKHTLALPVPWPLDGMSSPEWINTVIKPLLADQAGVRAVFNEPTTWQLKELREQSRYHYIGTIRLDSHTVTAHGLDPFLHRSIASDPALGIPLFWVGTADPGRFAVASGTLLEGTWRTNYGNGVKKPASDLSDLRYFANVAAIAGLLADLVGVLSEKLLQIQKKTRVRTLQVSAIKAQVQQIANVERFAFSIRTSARLIIILVRLEGSKQIRISVPFTEFENALPELRDTILKLRWLSQRGISFRTEQQPYRRSEITWTEPEPLDSQEH